MIYEKYKFENICILLNSISTDEMKQNNLIESFNSQGNSRNNLANLSIVI
jgi:hypothetical protein